ncbi:MAG: histidinol-phosphate transaminase [Prevotellaceae bacterium]|nr:histidinol-phosphate transaminase [Prevotellaceae bacterium]
MKKLEDLVRPSILAFESYKSGRELYDQNKACVLLDANESPNNQPLNRYPDPLQRKVKAALAPMKRVSEDQLFLANGSDEAIDVIYRCFCTPGKDNVIAIEPTYARYKAEALINEIEYRPVLLDEDFQVKCYDLLAEMDSNTKVIWICSPNNPTGNSIDRTEIERVLKQFQGIVVVDEAYSDFSSIPSLRTELNDYPNLIILNTFSIAWGCASVNLGVAYASKEIINIMNKVKYPYNVNEVTQREILNILGRTSDVAKSVIQILEERTRVMNAVEELPYCQRVFTSDANFFLARFDNGPAVYEYLKQKGIMVRDRNHVPLCENCLRITIGTKAENTALISALRQYE